MGLTHILSACCLFCDTRIDVAVEQRLYGRDMANLFCTKSSSAYHCGRNSAAGIIGLQHRI